MHTPANKGVWDGMSTSSNRRYVLIPPIINTEVRPDKPFSAAVPDRQVSVG